MIPDIIVFRMSLCGTLRADNARTMTAFRTMSAFDGGPGPMPDTLDTMIAALTKPVESSRRRLTEDEKRLVLALVDRAALFVSTEWLDQVHVAPADADAIGGLRFLPAYPTQVFGRRVAELRFLDTDGVDAIACLSLDRAGQPYTVDIARADRGPLRQIPELP